MTNPLTQKARFRDYIRMAWQLQLRGYAIAEKAPKSKAYECRYCGEISTSRPRKLVQTGGAVCTYCVDVLTTQNAEMVEMSDGEIDALPGPLRDPARKHGLAR